MSSYPRRRTFFIPPTSTGNNATSYLFDSTYGLISAPSATPGVFRGRYAGHGIKGTIYATGQNVTINYNGLVGSAGTSADWQSETPATSTVTAGTPFALRWTPVGVDFQLTVTNGGTGPTILVARLELCPIEEVQT